MVPVAGATLAGTTNATTCAFTASDSDGSIASVEFTLIGKDTRVTFPAVKSDVGYLCAFDTKLYPNGDYTLSARAVDGQGAEAAATVGVRIENSAEASPGAPACTLSPVDYVVEEFKVLNTSQHGLQRYARVRNLGCEQSFVLVNYVARQGTSLSADNQVLFSSDPGLGQPKRFLKTGEVGEFRAAFATCGEHQSDLAWGIDATVTPQFGPNGEHLLRLPPGGNHFSNPVPCTPPVCTAALTLTAGYSDGIVSILPAAPGAARPVTLLVSLDGGPNTLLPSARTGTAATFAVPQDNRDHTVAITAQLLDNGALCQANTSLRMEALQVCTTPLTVVASYANGAMSIAPTAAGGARPVTLTIAIDGAAPTTVQATTGAAASVPFVQDGSSHHAVIAGRLVGTNGVLCEAQATVSIPPRQTTCADIVATLQQTGPPLSTPANLSVNVSPSWIGAYPASLQLCAGAPITPTSGTAYPVTVARGATPTTCTMALVVDPTGLNCRAQLPLVVEPCSVVSPPLFRIDSSGATVAGGVATVALTATVSNYTGQRVGILLVEPGRERIKASAPVDQLCAAGAGSVTLSVMTERTPATGASYVAILYTGSDAAPVVTRDATGAEYRFPIPVR